MKKLLVFLLALGLCVAWSGFAKADPMWQTTPVLGFNSFYDGNVNVQTTTGWVVIPYYDPGYSPYPSTGSSMSMYTVGQEVHTGSGIYLDLLHTYDWSQVFTDLTSGRVVTWSDVFTDGGDGFVMLYGLGVDALTNADVGSWTYKETWTDVDTGASIDYQARFEVVPEPASIVLLATGFGVLLAAGWRRRK